MVAAYPRVRRAFALPIVVLVCALMVLPASAVLANHTHSPAAASAASVAVRPSSPSAPPYQIPTGLSLPSLNKLTAADLGRFGSSLTSLPSSPSVPASSFGTTVRSAGPLGSSPTPVGAQPSALSSLPVTDRVASLVQSGVVPARVAYYPNLNLLTHPITTPSEIVSPTYNVSPAPMGIADFGLGSEAYNLSTSGVQGSLFLAGYNATAGTLYQDTGAYYWDGLSPDAEVTPYQSGVQLNTVLANVSFPGSDTGVFWTQNVVQFSGSTLQFIDNVWNFSSPGAAMDPGTLYSYNGTLVPYDFYYAYGPTLPLSFPMTMELYNNASNVSGRTTLTFGYRVVEGTSVFTGIYDTVVFNSSSSPPLLTPQFLVDGQAASPAGLLYDAELVFGGPGGGSNSVINSLNGSMTLQYENGTGWMAAPSAYDYGADTGETAIGVAGWYTGTTEFVNQGPSILYGLWNASAGMLSQPGYISIDIQFNPSYAFAFIGPDGISSYNLSYAPVQTNGSLLAWLPPTINYDPLYFAEAFADGFDQGFGLLAGNISGTANLSYDPGVWNAPIYMNGEAQAETLAADATGWISGPFYFSGIQVDVNLTFNHLNDWGFPEFDLFWANNVSTSIFINDTYQGPNSPNGTTGYFAEYPFGWTNLADYGSEIAVWDSGYVSLQNLSFYGYELPIGIATGGAASLWDDVFAYAANTSSWDGSFGVWAANTEITMVSSFAAFDGVALTLVDSYFSTAVNISAYFDSAAVVSWGGGYGYFYGLNATEGSDGFYGIATNETEITVVNATLFSFGVELQGSADVEISPVFASNYSLGVNLADTLSAQVAYVFASNASTGVAAENDSYSSFALIWAFNDSQALQIDELNNSTIEDVWVSNYSYGIQAVSLNNVEILNFNVGDSYGTGSNGSEAGEIVYANYTVLEGLNVNASQGLFVVFANATQVGGVWATNESFGLLLYYNSNSTASEIYANDSLGLGIYGSTDTEDWVTDVTAVGGGLGVETGDAYDVNVTGIVANGTGASVSTGVYFEGSEDLYVNDVLAIGAAVGVNMSYSGYVEVTNVTAEGGALGVAVFYGSGVVYVQNVMSIDRPSIGVGIMNASEVEVVNVSATDAIGIVAVNASDLYFFDTNATDNATGVETTNSTDIEIYNTMATTGSVGVLVSGSSYAWVTNTTAVGAFVGVGADRSTDVFVQYTNVSGPGIGVVLFLANDSWVNNTSAVDDANAIVLVGTFAVHVENVTASSPYLEASPWPYTLLGLGAPDAAIISVATDRTTVANVSVSDYPVGLWDNGSLDLTVSGFAAMGGDFGAMLNGTVYGLFTGGMLSGNVIGLQMNDGAFGNIVTTSQFENNVGYGVDIQFGISNLVFDNSFVGNNGANGTYNPLAIQAFSDSPSNAFNSTAKVGNYWADWHTYANGVLAPYYISNGAWDYHPLGAPEGMYVVSFNETGIPLGTSWSVTLNGSTETSTGSSIVFDEYPGTYAFSIGAIAGWQITPSSGSVLVGTAPITVPVGFSALYPVQFVESGLASETTWTVVFNGVEQNVSGSTATFDVTAGSYSYTVLAPSGWAVSPSSGSVVVGGGYVVPLTFSSTVPPTYTVTVTETGLASGTSWSVVFNGVEETTTGTSLSFAVGAAMYTYQVLPVDGYTASVTNGSVTISGGQSVSVSFTAIAPAPTYTVYVNETGLPSETSWSVVFNGVEKTTEGTSVAFTVPAGTYTYQVLLVTGYTASVTSGSVTVSGVQSVAVTFTAVVPAPTYTVYVNETGLPSGTSWSVVFNGVEKTGTGTSLAFTDGAGTYTYQILPVAGYTASVTNGSVTISGSQGVSVTFTAAVAPPSTPAYVEKSTFNWEYGLALAIAVVAVLLALLALMRRPRAPAPAVPWKESSTDREVSASSPPGGASNP